MKPRRERVLLNWGVLLGVVGLLVVLMLPDYAGWVNLLAADLTVSGCAALAIRALLILAAGWIILSSTHHLFKRMAWKVGAFVGLFVYGVVIYRDAIDGSDLWIRILAPVNNTLSIFFPSRGSYSETGGLSGTIHFNVLHLLAYLYFAMIVFSIWGRRAINQSGLYLVPASRRNLFWGFSDGGLMLARDLMETTVWQQPVFVLPAGSGDDEAEGQRIFEQIDGMGAIALYRNVESFRRSPKGYRHFFLTEDQDFNVKAALRVIDLLMDDGGPEVTHLYVRTEMERIDQFFTDKLNGCLWVEVHLFNQSALTARQLVEVYPMLDSPGVTVDRATATVSGTFNLLLLGFGWTGYEVLKKCVCDAQFVGSGFGATIIDEEYDRKHGKFSLWLREAIAAYGLVVNPAGVSEVGGRAFYDWASVHLAGFNRVVVALGDDTLNIETALTLSKLRQSLGLGESRSVIFAHVRNVDKYDYYRASISPVTIFGDLSGIYTQGVLIGETMDRLAKVMNLKYSGGEPHECERLWLRASVFDQESTRAAALGIGNTLRLLGYRAVPAPAIAGERLVTAVEYDRRASGVLEVLAEAEHRRWCAFHLMNGILRWELADVTYEGLLLSGMKANQIGLKNRHAALVPFARLAELDGCINACRERWNGEHPDEEPKGRVCNQQNDRDFVTGVPAFLAAAGRVIVERDRS